VNIRQWPFPKDRAIHRARKMALAYRNIAEELNDILNTLATATTTITGALEQADKRLLAYDSPKTLTELHTALKNAQAALELIGDTNRVHDLDQRFTQWGETWHCEQPEHYEPDDYVRTSEAAKLIGISDKTMSSLRVHGKITGIFHKGSGATGGYWYLVRDVYALAETLPGRNWRTKRPTDTLNDSETGDST